jgi:hypothetical protein
MRPPPPLETIAAAREHVDDWERGLSVKIENWKREAKDARTKLKKNKGYRKKRTEGQEADQDTAKKKQKQKVWFIVLCLLSSDTAGFFPPQEH